MINIISTKQINNDNKQHPEEKMDHQTYIKHHRRIQGMPAPAKCLSILIFFILHSTFYIQHSAFIIFLPARQHQRPEHQCAVHNQQLVAELVAEEPLLGVRGQDIAENRDAEGDDRDEPAVRTRDLPLGEDAEGEQAQNRAVGVGGHHEDDADERVVVVLRDNENHRQEERGDDQVDDAAHVDLLLLRGEARLDVEKVIADGGREGREGAVRAGEARRDESEHEDQRTHLAQVVEGNLWIDAVSRELADIHAVVLREDEQHAAQQQEEDVDDHQDTGEREHIALRLPQRLAGQVLLHHILVQTGHRDGDEHTAENLLQEVAVVAPVGVEDSAAVGAVLAHGGHLRPDVAERAAHITHNHHNRNDQCANEKRGLQHIGPHHGLDAAAERVEQDDGNHHDGRRPNRDIPAVEDKDLQHKNHQIHAQCRSQQSRQEKKQCARLVCLVADALAEVFVNGGHVETVIERQQQQPDDDVAEDVAEDHSQIGELGGINVAGHRHERHARQRTANHAVSHHKPG